MAVGTRKILHCNVSRHPTATWTLQQFREVLPVDHPYKFLIHDRDSIFSPSLVRELQGFGLRVPRTPVRSPQANAYCERLVGTIRHENLRHLPFFSFNNRSTPHYLSFLTVQIFAGTVWTPFNPAPFAVPYRSTVNAIICSLISLADLFDDKNKFLVAHLLMPL